MFDIKPLIVVDVPVIFVSAPPFVGGFHMIVYEPVFSCEKLNVTDEVVDDSFVGELGFPGTNLRNYQ